METKSTGGYYSPDGSTFNFQLSMAKSEEEGAEVRQRLQLLIQCAIVNVDVYERETRVSKIHR